MGAAFFTSYTDSLIDSSASVLSGSGANVSLQLVDRIAEACQTEKHVDGKSNQRRQHQVY